MRGGSHATADRLGAGRDPGRGALGAALSQTRIDPATGAQVPGAAAPTAAPAMPRRPGVAVLNRAPPRGGGQVDWKAAVGGLRRAVGQSRPQPQPGGRRHDPRADPAARRRRPDGGRAIYSFGDYYTITADAPGAGVSLSGTTAVVPLPAGTPLKIAPAGPEGVTSQRTVDGQLISFVRYGVLYTVEVRCDAPTDPRCADDNYVRGLAAKTTTVVMGAAARAAAGLGAETMRKLLILSAAGPGPGLGKLRRHHQARRAGLHRRRGQDPRLARARSADARRRPERRRGRAAVQRAGTRRRRVRPSSPPIRPPRRPCRSTTTRPA